jgi:hypothetical protein
MTTRAKGYYWVTLDGETFPAYCNGEYFLPSGDYKKRVEIPETFYDHIGEQVSPPGS